MPEIKKNSKRFFQLVRLLGIIVFIILLFKLDLSEIWHHIKNVNVFLFLSGLILQIALLFSKAIRWHILKKGDFSNKKVLFDFGTFLESYAIGVFTPGRMGEMLKAGYGNSKKEKWNSFYKVLSERGIDLGIFILVAGSSAFYFKLLPIANFWIILTIFLSALMILFSAVLLVESKFKSILRTLLFNSKQNNNNFSEYSLKTTELIWVVVLSIIGNLITFYSCYLVALSVGLEIDILFVSGGVAVAGLLNLLPITIMGMGTREISFLYIFKEFNPAIVMAFSFAMFVILQVGGGIIAMLLGRLFLFLFKR